MKAKKIILTGVLLFGFLLVSFSSPVGLENVPAARNSPIMRSTIENYVVESTHPYTNNFDYTWTITKPGATQIRVHFTLIDTERRYDYVYVYDYQGTTLHRLTGLYSSGGWSAWSYGESIRVRLDTDYSVTDWGFKIDQIEYEGGGSDTIPPTISITFPSTGATIGGTTTIQTSASDNVGVTEVRFYIDGIYSGVDSSSPFSHIWDTTTATDGSHSIEAIAYDAAGNTGSDDITVTVDNGGSGGDNVLISDETVYSSLSATGETEMWTIAVDSGATSMRCVLNCGSVDFDLYGRLGVEPTTSVYDWRGYTSGGEDVTIDFPGEGTWYIMVRSYSGTGAYDLTVTVTYGGGSTWGTGGKYAIIVGISDYGYISDLNYCDEDATDWYNQLTPLGYECHVFGDGHTTNYPRYDGTATEATVRNAMQELAAHAQAGDTVAFITSGHGDGNGVGSSYLCMWDCSGSAGCYYDTELAADVDLYSAGVNIFVFIDHCYSGGMGPELMALGNSQYIYCTTTCTEDGYGWDDPTHQNGMWTYYFVDHSWQSYFSGATHQSMESIFVYAHDSYPKSGGDEPQQFDGNTGTYFYLA